jgi:hypothetical protein
MKLAPVLSSRATHGDTLVMRRSGEKFASPAKGDELPGKERAFAPQAGDDEH